MLQRVDNSHCLWCAMIYKCVQREKKYCSIYVWFLVLGPYLMMHRGYSWLFGKNYFGGDWRTRKNIGVDLCLAACKVSYMRYMPYMSYLLVTHTLYYILILKYWSFITSIKFSYSYFKQWINSFKMRKEN